MWSMLCLDVAGVGFNVFGVMLRMGIQGLGLNMIWGYVVSGRPGFGA